MPMWIITEKTINFFIVKNQKPGGKGQCIFAFLTEALPLIK
jgi:hypothetical protein